ncbi:MAG TPA: 2-C-methyl-D-erythritol 4-phosphate cytidylyltransferase, partial [Opitutus sp.]|nr:2-C-methyl-D-erythritol 4-phosphate cytidylyltransferase [Opitutus sp.]
MTTKQKIVGIILAGGSGNRFEADVPKQFCLLNGRMVIEHSVATFRESGLFAKIVVVLSPEWMENPRAAIGDINVLGGETRNESTLRALQACDPDTDLVLIHDAARPFVTTEILRNCMEALQTHESVDVCIPADDTIVQVADGMVEAIPDRRKLMRGQTPQGFRYAAICDAYRRAAGQLNASDDVSVFLRAGGSCRIVPGSPFNLKLTYPQDLFVAERILQYRPSRELPAPDLSGKKVLLLGATGGIGAVVAKGLRERGAAITAPTRNEWNLARREIPEAFVQPWDAIIHTAGILNNGNDLAGVDEMFAVNFRSVVAVTDLARRAMRG